MVVSAFGRSVLATVVLIGATAAHAQTTSTSTTTTTTAAPAATAASAQGESTTTLSDVTPKDADVKKEGDVDTDEVITNRKLRAETGAKKKFSFSSAITYSGGTINNPMSDKRPNITTAIGTQIDPRISGSLGMKYRLNPLNTFSVSVGVGIDKPFHGDDKKSFRERASASNPGVGYTTMYKVAGIQNVTSLSASVYTTDFLRTNGYFGGGGVSQTIVYDFGGSKFSVGTSISASAVYFDKNDASILRNQADFSVGTFPFVEYVINDKLNFRTLIGFMADHERAVGDFWTWKPNTIYQSAGLGISVTRDLYLYPNVQFIPEDNRADRTNVGITANLNL